MFDFYLNRPHILFTKSCVHLRKFIILITVAALAVLLSRRQNGKNCNGSEEEWASLAQKQKRRQSVNAATMPWSQCREWWVREREKQHLAKQIKRVVVLRTTIFLHSVRFENTLTFSNSFNVIRTLCLPSHTFHTSLHMHDRPSQKHVPRLLLVTVSPHMLVQRSWKCEQGIHCEHQRRLEASN